MTNFKRRPRYKGSHPRKFEDKYKELNPEKYQEDVEKIKSRGATPVGTHRPICVDEILEILKPKPGEVGLDATLGYGGHSSALLEKIVPGGKLIALDQDPIERPKTEARLREKWGEESLIVGAINFRDAHKFLLKIGIPRVSFVLADLGLSSMQIDAPDRGFSYKLDQPLDLRMNPEEGISAAEFILKSSEAKLMQILTENSDEVRAAPIAHVIYKNKPKTSLQLVNAVREAMEGFSARVKKEEGDAPVRRAFQALRIEVNEELKALEQFLLDLPKFLIPGGRVAILSFHSGEDRRVKKSFQAFKRSGLYSSVAEEFLRPSLNEQRSNPRSKSAKLRWAIKG